MSTQVDLTKLPAPQIIEEPEFETVLKEMRADLRKRAPGFTAGHLESDPAVKIAAGDWRTKRCCSERRINRAVQSGDARARKQAPTSRTSRLFSAFERQIVDEGDPEALPPRPPVYESDGRLRQRTQSALESFSTAGPVGAYVHHALSASTEVHDVAASSPAPGTVRVAVMSTADDGQPSDDLIATVRLALSDEDVRPLTDKVVVVKAGKRSTSVAGTLTLYRGPQSELAASAAKESLAVFLAKQRRLGEPITIDGLHAALRVEGVKKIALTSPSGDIEPNGDQYVHVTSVSITEAQA